MSELPRRPDIGSEEYCRDDEQWVRDSLGYYEAVAVCAVAALELARENGLMSHDVREAVEGALRAIEASNWRP